MGIILTTIETVLLGGLLGIFLVAYSHFRYGSYKLEFLMLAFSITTALILTKLIMILINFVIKVVT